MKDLWQTAFMEPLIEFLKQTGSLLPHLVLMIVILALGAFAGWALKSIIIRLLAAVKFDQYCSRAGLTQALAKGAVRETPSHLAGRIVYWTLMLVFVMLGLSALDLKFMDRFVGQVFSYLPHFLVALAILVFGFLLANFFGRATLIAAVNAQVNEARLLARGVRWATILFALSMAFEQMGIATTIIVAAFSIAFGGIVLALAIAFGLGARDSAKQFIEGRLKKDQEQKGEDISHL